MVSLSSPAADLLDQIEAIMFEDRLLQRRKHSEDLLIQLMSVLFR